MQLHSLNTGYFKLDGSAMFGVVPKTIWNKLNPADENNLCSWAARCMLVNDGNRKILIDTGLGYKQDEKFFGYYYRFGEDTLHGSLANIGVKPEDITDVLVTHLHFDHCGGCVEKKDGKLVTAFPKATYWSNEAHWKWATQPNPREKASFLKENILPIQESGQLSFLSAEKPSLTENFRVRFFDGHTKGMMVPEIQYKGKTIIYLADLIPSTAHLPIPYVIAYDMFPMLTIDEKTAFLKEALEKNFILFFEHDPKHECCDLQQTEKGIRMKSSFLLSEI